MPRTGAWIPRRRAIYLATGMILLLLGGGVAAVGTLLFSGQARADRPIADLVPETPPDVPGQWGTYYVDTTAQRSEWGLEGQATRTWTHPDGTTVRVTVGRFDSPVSGSLAFARTNPRQRSEEVSGEKVGNYDAIFDERPQHLPKNHDGVQHFCGQLLDKPGICDTRWLLLRHGQYLVEIVVENGASTDGSLPVWVQTLAETVHQNICARAPKVG